MEALDEKAKILVAELDKFATTKSKTDSNAFVDELKVDSLYTLAERWKTTAHSLPKVKLPSERPHIPKSDRFSDANAGVRITKVGGFYFTSGRLEVSKCSPIFIQISRTKFLH